MHKNYPSHVTKEQFENIKSILENSKKKTKPRSLDLYEIFCAILYVLKSGFQCWSDKTQWITYFCSITKKMNCRTKLCLIRKIQKIMKKLWKKTKY